MPVLDQGAVVKEVLVYDDHSIDRTAACVREVSMLSEKVRLIPPLALPQGWCGKPFACAQLAAEASGDWLLFIDADARIRQGAVRRMITEAIQRKATLLSFWPGLDMKGFWERALMPMLNFVVFSMFPAPLSFHMQMPALGLAHGACILIRRDVYQLTGGHAMVRAALFKDTVLARAWRKAGQTVFTDTSSAIRMMPPAMPSTPESMLVSTTAITMTISIDMAPHSPGGPSMKKAKARNMMVTRVE
jgi:GT2 family glycosyltransferase